MNPLQIKFKSRRERRRWRRLRDRWKQKQKRWRDRLRRDSPLIPRKDQFHEHIKDILLKQGFTATSMKRRENSPAPVPAHVPVTSINTDDGLPFFINEMGDIESNYKWVLCLHIQVRMIDVTF